METKLMTIFTRTPLHVGAGSSVGAVDSPIIRERHTGFPVIPGTSIKGVISDLWNDEREKDGERNGKPIMVRRGDAKILFGSDNQKSGKMCAGVVAIGEAKLLAFPVRSAKGCFAFVTSPICLERFARDAGLKDIEMPTISGEMTCLAAEEVIFKKDKDNKDIPDAVILEEYKFECKGAFPEAWAEKLSSLLDDDAVLKFAKSRMVLISDSDMKYFAENACQITQHVCIDSETGTAKQGALYNQEEVPSETLFYAPITVLRESVGEANADRVKTAVENFTNRFAHDSLIQFGAKGSTGIGYCTVKIA